MAITYTSRGSSTDITDLDTYTITLASAPTVGRLGCLFVNCFDNTSSQPPDPAMVHNGTTLTSIKVQDVDNAGSDRATMFLHAEIIASTSTSISIDFPFTGGNLANAIAWAYVEVDGADVSGTAANAFVTANTVGATAGTAGTTPTVNYAQAISNGNACLAGIGGQISGAFLGTPRANWTELQDVGAGNTSLATEYRVTGADTETAASGTITSTRWGIIAVEVKAAVTATRPLQSRRVGRRNRPRRATFA